MFYSLSTCIVPPREGPLGIEPSPRRSIIRATCLVADLAMGITLAAIGQGSLSEPLRYGLIGAGSDYSLDPACYLSARGGSAKWHRYDSSDAGEGFSLTKEMLEVDGSLQQATESGEIASRVLAVVGLMGTRIKKRVAPRFFLIGDNWI